MSGPDRSTIKRLIGSWEYRHARAFAAARFAAGGFTLGIGVVLFGLGHRAESDHERRKCYGWAIGFLLLTALQFAVGVLDMSAARPAPPRT